MKGFIQYGPHVYALYDGCKTWVPDGDTLSMMQGLLKMGGHDDLAKVQNLTGQSATVMRALGYIAGPRPANVDVYGQLEEG